uniref:Uncharacterized protein n=1 Tax=Anguilla anguilla TaxID=7936 RepID=A0A0E9TK33_ANGAN
MGMALAMYSSIHSGLLTRAVRASDLWA